MMITCCKKVIPILLLLLANVGGMNAQTSLNKENPPTSVRTEQRWWNLVRYQIAIEPDLNKKSITGTNKIGFTAIDTGSVMQVDLMAPMHIDKVTWNSRSLIVKRIDDYKHMVYIPGTIKAGETQTIEVHFSGQPTEALNAPNDNGWIWAKDSLNRPWITVACEGTGACVWLPCKEVLYDEPDSGVVMSITVPDTLVALGNGRLINKSKNKKGKTTYTWQVINPINDYNIIPYIGHYVSWHKDYAGLKGKLDCDYWVLDYSLKKAQKHLAQVDTMLQVFEYWLGPYPFYEDSYKIIETSYAGMEHQSAVAYGNGFQNGYKGRDFISNSGWGLKWDFIMVHESGHEWFGNSISTNNYSDTWIHEGFTKYLETLYTSYVFGVEAGNDYSIGTWKRIKNDQPVLGTNTMDKYYKGGAMLHMIRQIVGDTTFRGLLMELNKEFYHQTVNTQQVLALFNQYLEMDVTNIFDQYLTTIKVPQLEYAFAGNQLKYHWINSVEDFSMPVKISIEHNKPVFIYPTTNWQILPVAPGSKHLAVDRNFYVTSGTSD